MEKIVANQITKQVTENGTEIILDTCETKINTDNFSRKEIIIESVKLDIDKDVFISKVGGTLESSYIFYYKMNTNTGWTLGSSTPVDLSEYGITLTGASVKGDSIQINCNTDNNTITDTTYYTENTIFNSNEEIVNYVNLQCDNPDVYFILYGASIGTSILHYGTRLKAELCLVPDFNYFSIKAKSEKYFGKAKINFVVAKRVE